MKAKQKDLREKHRSPCPVARSLDLLGDRWTLLVVRDLLLGRTRFKEFAASPERIATNLLAERLARLRAWGVVEQVPSAPGARHPSYRLTAKGEALRPVVLALRDWGLAWESGTQVELEAVPAFSASVKPDFDWAAHLP